MSAILIETNMLNAFPRSQSIRLPNQQRASFKSLRLFSLSAMQSVMLCTIFRCLNHCTLERFLYIYRPLSLLTRCKLTKDFANMQEKEQKISPIKQRILQFVDTLGISKRDFYAQIGVSRGTLESRTGITEDVMAKFIAAYPNINYEWLLDGRGKMLKDDISSDCNVIQEKPVSATPSNSQEGIPLIPISAMAGALTSEQSILEYECERYVVPVFKGADFLIPVKGSSMYPKYSSGDIVACKRVPMSDLFFQWNKVYVIDTNQGALIKRIRRGSDDEHVLIVSDNTNYEPFELHLSSIYAVALVIGVIRLE